MVFSVKGEKGLHPLIGYEPEKDGEEKEDGRAVELHFPDRFFFFRLPGGEGIPLFPDFPQQDAQGEEEHQSGKQEGSRLIGFKQPGTEGKGDDGGDSAHEIDDPVGPRRFGSGVMSGIRAMVGERKTAIDRFNSSMKATKAAKFRWKGSRETNRADKGIPAIK